MNNVLIHNTCFIKRVGYKTNLIKMDNNNYNTAVVVKWSSAI